MVYSIGLTGNLASGKTTVAEIFSELGVEVINADTISRSLTTKGTNSYKIIVDHFGSKALLENGELNRRYLREIIFSNEHERLWLENLLHPLIRHQIEIQINNSISPYCVVEIPLLIDKQLYPYLNKVLLITAPQEIQIERVIKRDHCSREQALDILSAQPELAQRLKIADDVIHNDTGYTQLKHSVEQLHSKYLQEIRN